MARKPLSRTPTKGRHGGSDIQLTPQAQSVGFTRNLTAFHPASYVKVEQGRQNTPPQSPRFRLRTESSRIQHTGNLLSHEDDASDIGIALGSPTRSCTCEQDAVSEVSNPQSAGSVPSHKSLENVQVALPDNRMKRKTSKRDRLRRVFSRRSSEERLVLPVAVPPRNGKTAGQAQSGTEPDWPLPPKAQQTARSRSRTHPVGSGGRELRTGLDARPQTSGGRERREPSIANYDFLQQANHKPWLDVEIPKIEMERYSIMFATLLRHNQTLHGR